MISEILEAEHLVPMRMPEMYEFRHMHVPKISVTPCPLDMETLTKHQPEVCVLPIKRYVIPWANTLILWAYCAEKRVFYFDGTRIWQPPTGVVLRRKPEVWCGR